MSFYPDRIDDLKVILTRVISAATLFDDDGISIRFINWHPETGDGQKQQITLRDLNHIHDEGFGERVIAMTPFKGLTPIGSSLKKHVLDEKLLPDEPPDTTTLGILRKVQQGTLQKPVLIITITDGQPAGENIGPNDTTLRDVIRDTSSKLSSQPRYGPGAISFQFAQVGDDREATNFLAKLDSDPFVGKFIDCTSSKSITLAILRALS